MILFYINEPRALEICVWLNSQGYKIDEDYIWYRASGRDEQYAFICYNPELETILSLKFL